MTVRVVIENVTHFTQPLKFYEDMRAQGVRILYATDMYRPLEPIIREINNREHRKTTIIDDRIVSTGGFNLTEKYLADWTDIHLRITGPAAASYARLFYNYWHYFGDDEFCAVGSANIVIRSMYVNYENYTFIYGRDYTLKMKQMHLEREKLCRQLTLEEADGWSRWRRFLQRVANIIHPLM